MKKDFPWVPMFLGLMIGAGLVVSWWLFTDITEIFEPIESTVEAQLLIPQADLVGTFDGGKGQISRYIDDEGNGSTYCYVVEGTQAVSISCAWRP